MVTQLAFSPSQNLLAWADTGGVLSWWRDPIPAGSPDPVKATAAGGVQGVSVKRKSTPTFTGEAGDHGGVSGTVDDYGDDWIIDDIGIGMEDERGERQAVDGDGFVKEMGTSIEITCYFYSGDLVVSITKAQPAFQPGSTPMDGKKRYLGRLPFSVHRWIIQYGTPM